MPGALSTAPVDLNDVGTMVGLFQTADGVFHSFVRDQGVITEFAVPFVGAVETEVRGINTRGQIVGRYTVEPPDAGDTFASRGFVATPDRLGRRVGPGLVRFAPPSAETVTRLRAQEATTSRWSGTRRRRPWPPPANVRRAGMAVAPAETALVLDIVLSFCL